MTINLSEADLGRIFPHANDAIMSSVAAEWKELASRIWTVG